MLKFGFAAALLLTLAGCVSIEESERRCAAGDVSYCPSW